MNSELAGRYEVCNPWAEVDPLTLKGITTRIGDLAGKRIGLFGNKKQAARPILSAVEKNLKERSPDSVFIWYSARQISTPQRIADNKDEFAEWAKGVDAVIASVGD